MLKGLTSKELWATLFMSVSAFFLMCGYEILRTSTQSLFQAAYGTNQLPFITALMPLGVISFLYIYGVLLSSMGSKRTLLITSLISGLTIWISYYYVIHGSKLITGFLYIFRDAYIVLLVAQYWSFLNSTLTDASARKVNGPITGLSSLGGMCGGMILNTWAQKMGTSQMLLFSGFSVLPAAFFSAMAYAKCPEPMPAPKEKKGKQGHLGIKIIQQSPLLICLLMLVMASQVLSTVLMFSFQTSLHLAIPNMDSQTAFSGKFYASLNAFAFVLQFVIAPILMSVLPLGFIHLGIPVIHLICASFLLTHPTLSTAATAYFTFKALDYSLFNATKETLYIPLSYDARYRAKELIDAFAYRFSKGATSLLITGIQASGWLTQSLSSFYSWIALGTTFGWICAVIPILKHLPKVTWRAKPEGSSKEK